MAAGGKPPVCYGGLIVRVSDRCVLAQHTNDAADLDGQVWLEALGKAAALAAKTIDRVTYNVPGKAHSVYVLLRKERNTASVVIFAASVGQNLGFLACEKSLDLFHKMYPEEAKGLTPKQCGAMAAPLRELLAQFDDRSIVDERVAAVKRTIDEVKEVALDNVEKAIERGGKIEDMVDQTADLEMAAAGFHRSSRQLRQQLWWQNTKAKLMIGGAIALFLLIVWLVFCGGFSCSSSKNAPASVQPPVQ